LQSREVTRIGSNKPVPVDIRLISATNRPIHELTSQGQFREDLLYRINTIMLEIPPLRERQEDIPLLLQFFLDKYCEMENRNARLINECDKLMVQLAG
jgi:transcriptional regulator with PAS, ATPase and Fis domain